MRGPSLFENYCSCADFAVNTLGTCKHIECLLICVRQRFGRSFHQQSYEAVGYTIELPGSAVPGWPADVPLPVDPEWKSQYAASVRRLVRDAWILPWPIYLSMLP